MRKSEQHPTLRHLPIAFRQIDLCEEFGFSYLINKVINPLHRECVWYCDFVEAAIINAKTESFVWFWN